MATLAPSNEKQVVVFRLDGENYGIDIFRVNEIIRSREITPIPQTERHIRGLVNLRGRTIPVLDLRSRFGLAEVEDTESTRIIVVEAEDAHIGLVVDEVCEVMTLQVGEIESPPALIDVAETQYVQGIAKHNDRLITLLELNKVLGI